jgi:hypothetical protein
MTRTTPCCQEPRTLLHAGPVFARIITLGFYDGPTSGLAECAGCGSAYRFDMLDWNDDHQVRVFRLAALPPGSFERSVQVLARTEAPRWPVWVPWVSSRPSDADRERAERELQTILDRARPPELLIAWSGYGENVLAARKVPADELAAVPDWFSLQGPDEGDDWFSRLGLSRSEPHSPEATVL